MISTHMHATTCEKCDVEDNVEDISCREVVGNGGEFGDAYMSKDKLCDVKECVSGGRLGGVEGTRRPEGEIGGKGDEYKDEHAGKEGMIEAERRNGGLGSDLSEKESGKEELVLQDLGVEESVDRRIGDEIEHDGGFGGIEALARK